MKIKESKNLKYDKVPKSEFFEGPTVLDPRICILEKFDRVNDRIDFYFKNGGRATIKGKNPEGGREMDLIEGKLEALLGKSYEEILDEDF